ncbi:tRNA (adenosine(37)-N6)-threonylcarbamoyltransferase complex dimerization subunit type 1 TsaB [Rheinheimera sp.]|uniref:tRNA (adenosine(37)-N6)-threonylcarbamoyltransferase complex dimerization subunit type 1 TsaB n=1 Tax=Rheinheimera sp. TaxID=1869214 RepID=UPI00307F1B9A
MKLLALDTSTEACSVALQLNDQLLTLDEVCPQQHSKRVLPMVQQLLSEAGISLQQLDGLVFGKGPGSFTGVRIGVGVAQGLAFGADLPVFGVSTLTAMAQAAQRHHQAHQVVAAIDARMSEVYLASFSLDDFGLMQAITEEIACQPALLPAPVLKGPICAVGTGWQTYLTELTDWHKTGNSGEDEFAIVLHSPTILYPSAQDMLPHAAMACRLGQFFAAERAEPTYVRDEVTWQKLPGR